MAFLDHITACNQTVSKGFRPFVVGDRHLGWVRDDVSRMLDSYPHTLIVTPDHVALNPRLTDPQARSDAMDAVCADLHARCGTPALRGERYRVARHWSDEAAMTLDRGVVSLFGVRAFGIHVNGFVQDGDSLNIWVAERAADRAVAPGKLDNMIAGGQPAHLSLMDNLVKEAAEEAGVPEELARNARPAGAVSYCLEDCWGLKPDVMFCYDLDIPADFIPVNTDGEVARFALMDAHDAAARIRDTNNFKYNVNLVILDFLIRRGVLCPDQEPDYAAIVHGLKLGW